MKSITVDAQGTIWVTGGSDPTKLPLAAGTAALGPLYTVGLSSDGTSLISATTAPLGAAGMAIVATEQGAIVTLGEAGSLLIASPGFMGRVSAVPSSLSAGGHRGPAKGSVAGACPWTIFLARSFKFARVQLGRTVF